MNFLHRAEALLARAVLRLLRAMPPERASNFAGGFARAIGPYLPVSRVAHANLRAAMPELSDAERRRVVAGVWENLGRNVGELPHLAALQRTESGPGYEVANEPVLLEIARLGGPALFASGHIGNWEVLPPALARYGIAMASMYRAASNPVIDQMIGQLRAAATSLPAPNFAKGAAGGRAALMHLKNGGYLGMLVDQKLNDGIEAKLFGLKAMTAPALAMFSLRYRCPIIPGHVERLGPARFRLVPQPPLPLPETGDRQADIAALTQMINDRLEQMIRAKPEAWLWLHRRWPKDVVDTR